MSEMRNYALLTYLFFFNILDNIESISLYDNFLLVHPTNLKAGIYLKPNFAFAAEDLKPKWNSGSQSLNNIQIYLASRV